VNKERTERHHDAIEFPDGKIATVLLTGSTLSGAIMGFMEPAVTRRGGSLSQSSGPAE
jgi:hypothetical protein